MSFLPPEDLEYLTSKGIAFDEIEEGGNKAIILRDFALPEGKFDADRVDVLIILPSGYRDVAPNMFYVSPWIKLKATNRYARKADQPHDFAGVNWQRWSRHCKDWRPGVDGIWTMIKRIENALAEAG